MELFAEMFNYDFKGVHIT